MTPRVEVLELPATAEAVGRARAAVVSIVSRADWVTARQLEDVRLMVSEAVTNAVEAHHGGDQPDLERHDIVLRCEIDAAQVVVSVSDTAGGFAAPSEMPSVPEPDLDRERGLGLPLMALIADEVRFESSPDGTDVRLVIRRSDDA